MVFVGSHEITSQQISKIPQSTEIGPHEIKRLQFKVTLYTYTYTEYAVSIKVYNVALTNVIELYLSNPSYISKRTKGRWFLSQKWDPFQKLFFVFCFSKFTSQIKTYLKKPTSS